MNNSSPGSYAPPAFAIPFPLAPCKAGAMRLICFLSFSILFFVLPGNIASSAGETPIWSAGMIQVFSIQDRPGEMPVDLFSGPASPEERQKYFTDGKAPASVNVFLIRIAGKNILFDTGFGTIAPGKSELIPTLDKLGLAPESIDVVVLSHMHMDHAGGLLAHKQKAFPKASIMVGKTELESWLALADKDPGNANAKMVKTIIEIYGDAVLPPFAFGDEILPGVTAIDAAGHTPGHTAFHLEAEGKGMLIIGDLIHAAALQFPMPAECARYDMNPEKAIEARNKILNMASEKNIPVAGMHIPSPGYGSVKKQGTGFLFTQAGEKN